MEKIQQIILTIKRNVYLLQPIDELTEKIIQYLFSRKLFADSTRKVYLKMNVIAIRKLGIGDSIYLTRVRYRLNQFSLAR